MNKLAGIILLGLILTYMVWPSEVARTQQEAVIASEHQVTPNAQRGPRALVLLKEGTAVHLSLAQQVTGGAAVVGDPVELALAEDLRVGDAVVVRKGTRVLGTIIEGKASEKKRNRPKDLKIRVDFIKAGNTRILLRGEQAGVGKRNKKAMAAGTAIFGVSGLLLTMGKNYQIPLGTPVTAYVDQDIELPPLE